MSGSRRQRVNQSPNKSSPLARLGKVGALFVTLLSLAAAIISFLPRIVATVSDPVDANDPFSSTITVENTGSVPLEDVHFDIAVRNLSFSSYAAMVGDSDYSWLFAPDLGWGGHLNPADKYARPLNGVFHATRDDFEGADFGIVVIYRIPFTRWYRRKLFLEKAMRQSNGNWYWLSNPEPTSHAVPTTGMRITGPIGLPHQGNSNAAAPTK